MLVLVGVPVLLWQSAGREGMFLSDDVVRRGVVHVETCRPSVFPVIRTVCEGPVRWDEVSTWRNPSQVALGTGNRATVSTPGKLTGDVEVVSRVSRGPQAQHEVVVPATQQPRIPAWWWMAGIAWLPLVWGLLRPAAAIEGRLRQLR